MQSPRFTVTTFISRDTYSVFYEARFAQGSDKITSYAMKRIFLQNSSAVRCALREHHTLVRLALQHHQSRFRPTLFCRLRVHGSPTFVLSKGSDVDLLTLARHFDGAHEDGALVYSCTIISGLRCLHAMHIVHMDLKPENVLLSHSGHALITDFDRSYDMSGREGPLEVHDFRTTAHYAAPEIANRVEIATKADVWSLAPLMACIVSGPVRPAANRRSHAMRWAKSGHYRISNVRNPSRLLRDLFRSCLVCNYKERPEIAGVKKLRSYCGVDWDGIASCTLRSPYHPSQLTSQATRRYFVGNRRDFLLLGTAYDKEMALVTHRLHCTLDSDGVRRVVTVPPDTEEPAESSFTPDKIEGLMTQFDFTNPLLRTHDNSSDVAESPVRLESE